MSSKRQKTDTFEQIYAGAITISPRSYIVIHSVDEYSDNYEVHGTLHSEDQAPEDKCYTIRTDLFNGLLKHSGSQIEYGEIVPNIVISGNTLTNEDIIFRLFRDHRLTFGVYQEYIMKQICTLEKIDLNDLARYVYTDYMICAWDSKIWSQLWDSKSKLCRQIEKIGILISRTHAYNLYGTKYSDVCKFMKKDGKELQLCHYEKLSHEMRITHSFPR